MVGREYREGAKWKDGKESREQAAMEVAFNV
jgi:hypothetical protein